MDDELEPGYDPLDSLFGGESTQEAPAGEESTAETTSGDAGESTQEAPAGEDAVVGDKADDKGVKMVPLAALEEARQRAKDAEARADARATEKKDDKPAEETPFPDFSENPQGFVEALIGNVQLNNVNTALNISEEMARDKHGDELVDKVRDWALSKFESDPAYAQKVLFATNPYKVAIADYNDAQRSEKLKDLPPEVLDGLDEEELAWIKARRAERKGSEQAGSTGEGVNEPQRGEDGKFVAPARRSADPPPRSMAKEAPASGKPMTEVATGPGVAFDGAFGN